MCGLAGFLSRDPVSDFEKATVLPAMAAAIAHRGPDDEGFWSDAGAGIALCHRRLSILDLSPLGHQPMFSASDRYVIVFNGEIYNYRDLRHELMALGSSFKGGSDTEVLLAAVEQWGLERTLERSAGMFAFALWDRLERTLVLARDRFGEKPLYFGVVGRTLLFGSELKALRMHPAWTNEIDRDALALMMQQDYIPAPFSIFKGIRKVLAGAFVRVQVRNDGFRIDEQRYWRPERLFDSEADSATSAEDALASVERALTVSVERQMIADVPLGAFLSGGTDSSLVVALMQKMASQPVRTFSIGFSESEYDESPFARAVAKHLGTHHTEYTVTPRDCLDVIPLLPQIYDEPFADQSQIPTYLVSKLARRDVTVALSGDGGDELFGGYGRYRIAMSKWQSLRRVPRALRAGGRAIVERIPLGALQLATSPANILARGQAHGIADRLHERSSRWAAATLRDFYRVGLKRWQLPHQPVLGVSALDLEMPDAIRLQHADGLKQMMHFDTCCYLPDDILVKVDRAAMAVSLETRVPILDVDVAKAAWQIPSSILMKDGRGKWVLRELLSRHIPRDLINRPKKGFAVPIARWLRADLRGWASSLLDPYRLRQEGYFDAAMVQRRWRQHLTGQANWHSHLWNVLMFQAWLEKWQGERIAQTSHARAS
ncbi:MAG TPA: asparagine synthase (glutamine-hydrolyzing) [Steroidobacteraceae bacterium]|nr:asparagine synthase (glutamine-hydrolyzing) [Steroidobacteraceae bacterium]